MNKVIFSFLVGVMAAVVQAATYRVTPVPPTDSNGSGSSWANAISIDQLNAKIAANAHGDIVLLKAGVYKPSVKIFLGYNITIRGGMAGIDDVTIDSNNEKSVLDGQNTLSTIISTKHNGLITIENLEIRNAYQRAIDTLVDVNDLPKGSFLFKKCVFDSCGRKWNRSISAPDGVQSLRGLVGRFVANSTSNPTLSFEDCVFSRNMYEENDNDTLGLGMGIAIGCVGWKRVTFDGCHFVSNGIGRATLKSTSGGSGLNNTRGAAIYSESPLTVRNTEFRANRAGISAGYGGIVYIRNAKSNSAFTNCLFMANSCEHISSDSTSKEGGIIAFRSSTGDILDVVNCTFAYNFTASKNKVSAGVDVGSSNSKANIRNSIFYGAQKLDYHGAQKADYLKCGKDICVSSGCTANIDYCLFEEDSTECISGTGTINKGSNNQFGDPKFVRAITEDEISSVITKSGTYFGYSEDAYESVFSKADVHTTSQKLTVDTGDPTSPYDKEPSPNGKRVNLGYYGNTPEALATMSGLKIYFR